MKAKIIETIGVFKPFTIELTIESEEELCDLLNRLNMGASTINKQEHKWLKHDCMNISIEKGGFWNILREKAKESNLIL